MKTLPADLEALMPEPFSYPVGDVTGPCACGSWPGGKCLRCAPINFFTADQMREAIRGATERSQDDTKRLDWIVRQADEFSCGMIVDAPGDGEYVVHGMDGWGQGVTPREAIDAAMRFRSGGEAWS